MRVDLHNVQGDGSDHVLAAVFLLISFVSYHEKCFKCYSIKAEEERTIVLGAPKSFPNCFLAIKCKIENRQSKYKKGKCAPDEQPIILWTMKNRNKNDINTKQ